MPAMENSFQAGLRERATAPLKESTQLAAALKRARRTAAHDWRQHPGFDLVPNRLAHLRIIVLVLNTQEDTGPVTSPNR